MGDKIILVQPNLIFRSSSSNKLEKKSIEEAFAKSVPFWFKIYKSTKTDIFIDLTPFLMQDMHGVSDRLEKRERVNILLMRTDLLFFRKN